MPYPYRIIKAIESSVRAQITNALNELALLVGGGISDTAYDASWNGSTDVAPSQNAVYDKIETIGGTLVSDTAYDATTWNGVTTIAPSKNAVRDQFEVLGDADDALDARLDVLEGFRPSMMQFDSDSYYTGTFTSSGNKVMGFCEFQILPFTGDAFSRLIYVTGPLGNARFLISIHSDDYTTTALQNKVTFYSETSSDVPICSVRSNVEVADGEKHSVYASFDADTGDLVFVVDGDAAAYTVITTPATGTLDSGAGSIEINALAGADQRLAGNIGFIGYKDAYDIGWTDFFTAAGDAKNIDTVGWTEFSTQPEYFNPHGQLTNNLGSEANLSQYGSVLIANPGYQSAEGIVPGSAATGTSLTGYYPAMMRFDGSTGYYSKTSVTYSGNKVTVVFRFYAPTFTGATAAQAVFWAADSSGNRRVVATIFSSDFSTAGVRGRLSLQTRNTSNTILCNLFSFDSVFDGEEHTCFFEFDGDAGTAVFEIDSVDADDTGNATRTAPTAGTVANGAGGSLHVGAAAGPNLYFSGRVGYFGLRDVGGLNPDNFFENDGTPKELDEISWAEWGAQPLFWNPHAQMTYNLGSSGAMTKNGTVRLWLNGFGNSAGLLI